MPSPTFPTGTVNGESLGDRTFPPRTDPPHGRARESTDAAADAVRPTSDADARTRTDDARTATDGGAQTAPDADARPPRGDDGPASRAEELAALRRENEELRRTLRETRKQRQDVIDRYERLLADGDAAGSDPAPEPPERSLPTPPADSFFDGFGAELGDRWRRLRRRYDRWRR